MQSNTCDLPSSVVEFAWVEFLAAPRFEPGNSWQALVAGIPSRFWTGRFGKPRQPEGRRNQPQGASRDDVEVPKTGAKPSQDRSTRREERPKRIENGEE